MRTARLLTISQHALLGGVTCLGEVPAQGAGGVPAKGGVPALGVNLPGGVPARGEGAVPARGGTCPGTPPVNRMTDRCKNITLPQTSFADGNNSNI